MQKALYRDYDALAYNPKHVGEERGAINYIKKTKQRQKGVEIVFDPKAHKDFVTGFRKRKQQRRKEAEKQILKKSKAQRLEDRAQRRKELKHQLGLPDDYGVQDSDTERGPADPAVDAAKADVKQYQQGQYVTTVSVINMNMDSDEEQQQQSTSGSEDDTEPQQQQQRHQGKHNSSSAGSRGKSSLKNGRGRVQKASTATKSHQKKKRKQKR